MNNKRICERCKKRPITMVNYMMSSGNVVLREDRYCEPCYRAMLLEAKQQKPGPSETK